MEIKRLNVFATDEEMAEINKLHHIAVNTPVIAFTSADALSGNDLASRAWKQLMERVHKIALTKGLPEIQGYYGIDGENKEFIEGGDE